MHLVGGWTILIIGLWVYPHEQLRLRSDTTHRIVRPLKFVRLFIHPHPRLREHDKGPVRN
jgi:hypothetical protein